MLSRASVRMMTTNQIGNFFVKEDFKFGMGFGIYTDKSSSKSPVSEGSFDSGGMFGSSFWIDPKEKIVAQLFLQQSQNSRGILDKFKVLVYQAIMD